MASIAAMAITIASTENYKQPTSKLFLIIYSNKKFSLHTDRGTNANFDFCYDDLIFNLKLKKHMQHQNLLHDNHNYPFQ